MFDEWELNRACFICEILAHGVTSLTFNVEINDADFAGHQLVKQCIEQFTQRFSLAQVNANLFFNCH